MQILNIFDTLNDDKITRNSNLIDVFIVEATSRKSRQCNVEHHRKLGRRPN